MSKMKVLITGANGFLGTNITRYLKEYEVHAVTHLAHHNIKDHADVIWKGDIQYGLDWVQNQDYVAVVHLASLCCARNVTSVEDALNVNTLGTLAVLRWCKKNGVRMINFSSIAALDPQNIYAASKAAAEQFFPVYANDVDIINIRPTNVYGPFSWDSPTIIPTICKALLKEQPVQINVMAWRNFVFVDDIARLVEHAILSGKFGLVTSGDFEAGQHAPRPLEDVVLELIEISGRDPKEIIRFRHSDHKSIDNENAPLAHLTEQAYGWRPAVDLSTGLKRTWNWFQQEYEKRMKRQVDW